MFRKTANKELSVFIPHAGVVLLDLPSLRHHFDHDDNEDNSDDKGTNDDDNNYARLGLVVGGRFTDGWSTSGGGRSC